MLSNHISTIEKNLLWLMVLYLKASILLSQISLDKAVLQHIAHMGVNKTLYRARQSVFWPCLTKDINEIISACPTCMKYAAKNCAEHLINDLATSKPWQALNIDNFEWKAHKYLVTLDHFSHFIVVKSSDRIDTATTIKLLLEVFAEHGIPNKIRCDRGSNFTSIDFTNYCSDLGITLSFSSSYHHQSVPAECSMHTVKNIMKKCHETGTPWCLGLLEYLRTPLDDKTPSPSSLIVSSKDFVPLLVPCKNHKRVH